ncbi:alpha/beta fold hydrolase [Hydrogenimonas sp.]
MARKNIAYRGEDFPISYEILNPDAPHDLVVLHGWGSHKALMQGWLGRGLKGWRHIYIDLPGFGKSPNERAVLTTDDYAAITKALLESIGARPDAAVGHSFGGKVATLLNPEKLVLLSSSGVVWPKPLAVRAKIALFKFLKPLGGHRLRRLFASEDAAHMPQNMYETFKKVVDEDFLPRFGAYEGEALLLWGASDTATPIKSGEAIAKAMKRARLEIVPGDHYFFLQDPEGVISRMEAFLETV